jgi:NAD-dependent deacetylase
VEIERLIRRAARDLVHAGFAIALTGAGISTESGIPDWREASQGGTDYTGAGKPEPKRAAHSYEEFLADPEQWWRGRLAHIITSTREREKAEPNLGHYALVELETLRVLMCVITSNVDGLHWKANTYSLLEFHGSFRKLRCTSCGSRFQYDSEDFETLQRENKLPPLCPYCKGIMKRDVVFFGEPIPADVQRESQGLVTMCDLMLVCGTTASVYPFGELPNIAKNWGAKIIEINKEPTRLTEEKISSYLIQGKTGEILPAIVAQVKKLLNKEPKG